MEKDSKPERYDDTSETAPLRGNDSDEEDQEAQRLFRSGCGCFRWRRRRTQDQKEEEKRGTCVWLREKAKKMKQLSEIVAGPRWKNFIRRSSKKKKTTLNFQYDPRSYALNFDDGIDKDMYLNFSGRYVVPMKP